MTTKYLDSNGLSYFWGKLKDYFQPKLVSGTNIKTVNNTSLLGSGDITISGSGAVSGVKGAAESSYRTGNVSLNYSNLGFVIEEKSVSTGSISATTDSGSKSLTATKSGYYPIGIVGYSFSGTNHMHQNCYYLRLSSASSGSATVTYRFRNFASAAYSGTFAVDILWAKA